MSRKKIDVVELNKKEEKIVLEERQSSIPLFWIKHRLLIFLTLLILSLTILSVGILLNIKNFKKSEEPTIKEVSVDTSLDDYNASIVTGNNSLTEESAKTTFDNNNLFKGSGEVLLVKILEHSNFTVEYYSDGTAIKTMKNGKTITRINALENGEYGIDNMGIINSKTITSDVTIKSIKEYPWGKVTYYLDGSAKIDNSKMNIFVRNGSDIKDNYISNNKVSYLKETKEFGNTKLNYYYDGTTEIIMNNKSYIVRDENDINIENNQISFKNNNQATIISSKKMDDGRVIDYYEDGGAIIRDGTRTISVRKSNSIVIKNNKIYEIVDNIYVEISKKTNEVTYYTNGGATVYYNNKTYYTEENSNIKYQDDKIKTITNKIEDLSKETNISNENVKTFEQTAVITTNDYIAIVPSDKVLYDENGKIKELNQIDIEDNKNSFTVVNNTNEKIKYRVVISKSPRTNLDVEYIRYMYSTKNYKSQASRLDSNIWTNDKISSIFDIKGTNYILIDSTIEAHDKEDISIMLWTDYDTIPNSMQDKYFYGTIRVYAWTEIK